MRGPWRSPPALAVLKHPMAPYACPPLIQRDCRWRFHRSDLLLGLLPVHTGGSQTQEGLGDSCLANIISILSTHSEPRASCSMCCSCPAVVIWQQIPGKHIFLLGVE